MFFNFERYDLSKVGRYKTLVSSSRIKAKKERSISKEDRVLSIQDIIEVIKEIIRLNNDPLSHPDQIDHLGNRRVRNFQNFCPVN